MAPQTASGGLSLLRVENVTVRFGGLVALQDVNIEVRQGGISGLIGPNGAGKSTLFNVVSAFVQPAAGMIYYRERDLRQVGSHGLASLGIARTFQELSLHPSATVRESILAGCHNWIRSGFLGEVLGLPAVRAEERKANQRVDEILVLLELQPSADRLIRHLPYGVAKLVELGRALASRPSLLLLDEPAAGLNSAESERMTHLIRRLNEEFGVTVLLIEHDMPLVMDLCHNIHVLNFGRKIAEGSPSEISSSPEVITAYLGGGEASA